jgi:hypothetical protein
MSSMFDTGMRNNMFMLDMYQNSVRLYNYDDVRGALLDMSKESVRTFITDKLRRLSKIMDITSFKLKKVPVSLHTSNADGGKHVISHPGIKHGGHIRHHWRYWQYKFTIVTFQNLQTV